MSDAVILVSENDGSDEWVASMARIQYAMWVDEGAVCAWCEKPYASVDDFITRNPRLGLGFREGESITDYFVDDACWPEYEREAEPYKEEG